MEQRATPIPMLETEYEAPKRLVLAPEPRRTSPAVWVLLGASALVVIGSLLPWATAGILSADGTSGDGQITLVCGLLAIGTVLLATFKAWQPTLLRMATLGLLLGALATAGYEVVHVSTEHVSLLGTSVGFQVGSGLWLCLIASVVAVAAWVVEFRASRATR